MSTATSLAIRIIEDWGSEDEDYTESSVRMQTSDLLVPSTLGSETTPSSAATIGIKEDEGSRDAKGKGNTDVLSGSTGRDGKNKHANGVSVANSTGYDVTNSSHNEHADHLAGNPCTVTIKQEPPDDIAMTNGSHHEHADHLAANPCTVTIKQEPPDEIAMTSGSRNEHTDHLPAPCTVTIKQEPLDDIDMTSSSHNEHTDHLAAPCTVTIKQEPPDDIAMTNVSHHEHADHLAGNPCAVTIKQEPPDDVGMTNCNREHSRADNPPHAFVDPLVDSHMQVRMWQEPPDVVTMTNFNNDCSMVHATSQENVYPLQSSVIKDTPEEITMPNGRIWVKKDIAATHVKEAVDVSNIKIELYFCSQCNFRTESKNDFEHHSKEHIVKKRFACDRCDYRAINSFCLKSHVMSHHKEEHGVKRRQDVKCETSSDTKVINEEAFESLICEECDFWCSRESEMKKHRVLIHSEMKGIACTFCDYSCNKLTEFNVHIMGHRGGLFRCDKCKEKFHSAEELCSHVVSHAGPQDFLKCEFCDFKCPLGNQMKTHMLEHTGEFVCDYCDFRFSSDVDRQSHRAAHTGQKIPFACDICNYKTNKKRRFRAHMTTHVGEKLYACDCCDFKCSSGIRLKVHIAHHCRRRTVHAATLKKPITPCHVQGDRRKSKSHACEYCDYKGSSRWDVSRHVSFKHRDHLLLRDLFQGLQ